MKHNLKVLAAVVLVLAIFVGGYFLLVNWNPDFETEQKPDTETEKTEYLIDAEAESIDYIEFNTGEVRYTLRNGEKPSIEGYVSHVIDSSKLSSAIYNCCSVAISHKIKGKIESLSEFGLGDGAKSVLISLKDGTQYKLLLGNSANFEGEYYAMLDGSDFVCTISSYEVENLLINPAEFRSMDICTIDNTSVKALAIEKNGKKEVEVIYDEAFVPEHEYQSVSYLVTYPYNRVTASLDKLDAVFEKLTSLTAESIVEENPSNLASYGLDNPYVLKVTDNNGKTTTVKMGDYGDGGNVYVMSNNLPVVYLANCPFYEIVKESKADDYVERFINLFNITTVESVEFNADGKTDKLEIIKKSEDKYSYKINGKLVSEDRFKDIYQAIIGVTATDFVSGTPGGEEKCSVKFNFTGGKSKTVTYYIYDERHCIVKGDNQITCLTLTKNLDNIINMLKQEK